MRSPSLFAAMRDLPTVCEQLHLPVQAGDDDLLRRMRRLYTRRRIPREDRGCGGRRRSAPRAEHRHHRRVLRRDAMQSSPAPNALMRDLRFDTVHLAAYSVRPGTAAARRERRCAAALEEGARLNHLLAVQREIAAGRNALYVGSKVEILVDGIADRRAGHTGAPGRTRSRGCQPARRGRASCTRPGGRRKRVAVARRAGRHGGVRTSSNIRAPHFVAAVPEAPHTTLDLQTRGRHAHPARISGRQSRAP